MDRTMSKLSDLAYWIGMGSSVADHCNFGVKYQYCKTPSSKPVRLGLGRWYQWIYLRFLSQKIKINTY